MHLYEIDWRIKPLHDILVGIKAGLEAIGEHINDEEGFDGFSALEHAEPLLGLCFVAAQNYALGTVADLNRIRDSHSKPGKDKNDCYLCDSVTLRGGTTRIQLVNAVANYFKHHDEWSRWPTRKDRGFRDTEILASVGITQKTEHPCVEATNLLCGTSWEIIVLHQIIKEWRAHVINKLV